MKRYINKRFLDRYVFPSFIVFNVLLIFAIIFVAFDTRHHGMIVIDMPKETEDE